MFSKACEYAMRAALYVATKSAESSKPGIKEIAREIDSPVPFTAKLLQSLSRKGFISSTKGPQGGFYIKPSAKPIRLAAIVKAIDGVDSLHSCALGLKECSDKFPCPIHEEVKAYKTKLRRVMNEKTIQQLSKELSRGRTFLKNEASKTR